VVPLLNLYLIIVRIIESLLFLNLLQLEVDEAVPIMKWNLGGAHLLIEGLGIHIVHPTRQKRGVVASETVLMMKHFKG
jgi:hypothetical protein